MIIIAGLIGGFFTLYAVFLDHNLTENEHKVSIDELNVTSIISSEAAYVVNGSNECIMKAISLYSNNASIVDAAGGNKALEKSWFRTDEITDRYKNLTKFETLSHNDVNVKCIRAQRLHGLTQKDHTGPMGY